MKKMKFIFLTGLSSLLFLIALPNKLEANPGKGKQSIFDVLQQKQILKVSLEFPWEYLKENRRDTNEHKALFTFFPETGKQQEWLTEVTLRGRFRRMRCAEMPPLKIKFKKKHLRSAGLNTHNDLKLVSYCQDDSELSKEALLKEYLAYRLYQQITPASFRVQLIEITYIDSNSGLSETQIAFLIEDTSQLRERLSAKKPEKFRYISPEDFQQETRQTAAMYQFLIGNTDWSLTTPRNIKYAEKDGKIIPIPYDFDFSRFVNAPYALITKTHYQTAINGRVWLGFSEDKQLLFDHDDFFKEFKSDFKKLIRQTKLLSKDSRNELKDYLTSFFEGEQNLTSVEKVTLD